MKVARTSGTVRGAAVLVSALAAGPAGAQTSGRADGMRFVPDATHAIRTLMQRPDALGFHIDGTPDPTTCKHYQGMVRVDAADGTPYFLVSRSGNTPNVPGPDDQVCAGQTDNGYLIVVRMGSRPRHGERLRSNRLARGRLITATAPPQTDRAVRYFTVVGGNPAAADPAERPGLVPGEAVGMPERVYQHPGGMSLVGHMLALALEHPRQEGYLPRTQIMFFDVSNPEAPVFRSQYTPINGAGEVRASAGVVAVTPLPGGLYLMVTAGGEKNRTWFFYRSTLPDLSSPGLSWDYIGSAPGPSVEDGHQTLAFLREGSMDGALYVAGSRGHPVYADRDRIDLYRVTCETVDCAGGEHIEISTVWHGRRITPAPSSGEIGMLGNLAAASAFHVTPSGELIFYATEHDNGGPDGTVRAGEWRNIEVVRDGSPTLMPGVAVSAPVSVLEGGTVRLSGSARPPITRPFIQLFSNLDFTGYSAIADIEDIALEEWNDLRGVAESWNWYAPPGCRIVAVDHDGAGARTLSGTGLVQRDPDLREVLNDAGSVDMHQKVDEVFFAAGGTCSTHYDQVFALRWDLDANGSFESVGSPVSFSAANFDGPSVVTVPAMAQGVSTGAAAQTAATVTVINVPPVFTRFRLTDDAGNQVNAAVPFMVTHVPVLVDAAFRDAGRLDRQTAALSWGDGRVDAHTAFQSFTDAFGGAAGAAAHRRTYTLPGTYRVRLTVTDDDRGAVSASAQVRVHAPDQAVVEIVALIDAALAAGTSRTPPAALAHLRSARDALAGTGKGQNGALHQIRVGNYAAARELVSQAITSVRAAITNGASVNTVYLLLQQVMTALSTLAGR